MKEPLLITESPEKLTIEISPVMKPAIKFGLVFQGILMLGFAVFFFIILISWIAEVPLMFLGMLLVIILYFVVGKNYLKRVFYKEIVEVTKDELTLTDKYLTSTQTVSFPVAEIAKISFAGQHNYTKHPFTNNTLDVTGVSITENEVQYLIDDGTIEIQCNGVSRRFGKNIGSWDAEEIIDRIGKFTHIHTGKKNG